MNCSHKPLSLSGRVASGATNAPRVADRAISVNLSTVSPWSFVIARTVFTFLVTEVDTLERVEREKERDRERE